MDKTPIKFGVFLLAPIIPVIYVPAWTGTPSESDSKK
jgi:hypothetical protein